jgi:uncharacterized NAD-dependent epimerase/dehydratase family protein
MRFVILVEGLFGPLSSKTANSCIRYAPERVAAVLDSTQAGATAERVLGFGGEIPVVATLEDSLAYEPTALLIGSAPVGGRLPDSWRAVVRDALERGMSVWSGLHTLLGDDEEFAALARTHGASIRDLRRPPAMLPVASGRVREVAATIVLTVGSDCNIGKMTAALQIRDGLRSRGRKARFAGTGQTGILIEGWGIAVDAVIADFIGGAAEQLVLEAAVGAEIVLVEGQGSITHPGYSGVTTGLLHGSMPHAMVLCTQPSREHISDMPWARMTPLAELIRLHQDLARPVREAPVIAVSLNTYDLSRAEAETAVARAREETGLPATDPVRFDPAPLVDAVADFHAARTG